VFLVNSHNRRFTATTNGSWRGANHRQRHTFSRSYGVNLPSSLTRVLSRALGFSPRPPESVCSTITKEAPHAAFLGSMGSLSIPAKGRTSSPLGLASRCLSLSGPDDSAYGFEHGTIHRVELPFSVPACFNVYLGGAGILTCFPSPTPLGLGLGID
jgi:hypothetical protein